MASQLPVGSASLASYDPTYESARRMRDAALDLLALLTDLATPRPVS